MTIIFGAVPANPTRRFKNWKTHSLSSVIKVKRRNLRRSLQRSNRDFGSGLCFGVGLSASQPQPQLSCLSLHSEFSSGVKSRTPLLGRDGTLKASQALHEWNQMPSGKTREPPSLASAKHLS